ncbi:hypothetical protein PHMEG_00041702, partial [Phytophthora megakarya]
FISSRDFESGCVRVLRDNSNRLTRMEKAVLQPFAASAATAPESDAEESSSFVERLQKRRMLAQHEQKYVLIRSIPPTSNIVERFFSIARTTFGQECNNLQPATLEQILFLRQNASCWNVGTIDSLRS